MRSIKIELWPHGENKKDYWNRISMLSKDVFKASNHIVNSLYFSDLYQKKEAVLNGQSELVNKRITLYRKLKIAKESLKNESDPEQKNIIKEAYDMLNEKYKDIDNHLKEIQKDASSKFQETFGVGPSAVAEREVKESFPEIPPCVSNILVNNVNGYYNKERIDVLKGGRSLRTYRKEIPIPTHKTSIEFYDQDDIGQDGNTYNHHYVKWKLSRTEHIIFQVFYGRDRANNRLTIQRLMEGTYSWGAPSIELSSKGNKKRKIFLSIPIDEGDKELELDPNLSVGVDLGMAVPAVCALSGKSQSHLFIGTLKDFLRVRTAMQARRRRLQKNLVTVPGGKGRGKKLSALNRIKDAERNFVKQYNHMVSKQIVEFAKKNRAGVIKMEMLEGFGKDRNPKYDFVLRNWSFYELQTMVEYKAKMYGIAVVKVDPYHTSQTCSVCGHYEANQRKTQSEFLCAEHTKAINADLNASKNIANSSLIVTKREECTYYKLSRG